MPDSRWNRPCSLMGCKQRYRPHHHHFLLGHLDTQACTCPEIGEPGTLISDERGQTR